MKLEEHQSRLERMKIDFATMAERDVEVFAACVAWEARQIRGALWSPACRGDAQSLASEFEQLAQQAALRLYPWSTP
jgi:hypothetical protein